MNSDDLMYPVPQDGDDQALAVADDEQGVDGLDPLAGAGIEKRSHGGSLLIVAVILIAVAGLVSMRRLAQVTAAANVDNDIANTIESFLLKRGGDDPKHAIDLRTDVMGETVLARLSETYSDRQVPLRDVHRNPFVLFRDETPITTDVLPPPGEDPAETRRRYLERQANRRAELAAEAATFSLKSIMGGSVPLALIDGEIVRIGETLVSPAGVVFRVEDISGDTVEILTAEPALDLTVRTVVQLQRDR